ncbi:alpha/beta hydrolase fold domain-containing protein [Phthorimaea operculella]|nr:alpha/beta hydrolase fold domain-containing protein [Phthorimaea operculella]
MILSLVIILGVLQSGAQILPPVIKDILDPSAALALVPDFLKTIDIPVPSPPSADCLLQHDQGFDNEEKYMNFTELATKYGRNVSSHTVNTRDGYCLTVHRLYGPGEPVLIFHGLFSSSIDFITSGPLSSIAYILNEAGYDVWLGNARGNTYSRCHETLDPEADAAKFWNFSWHEIGLEDVPATIDYILLTTGRSRVKFIGHAQGVTTALVMLAERPEYNSKVSVVASLSAIAWFGNTISPFMRLISLGSPVLDISRELLGTNEFLPENPLTSALRNALCGNVAGANTVCESLISLIGGVDYAQFNCTNLPVQLNHIPSPTATKQAVHFGQLVSSKRFQKFDYGAENTDVYGLEIPPEYKVEEITTPVAILWGDGDWLATFADVNILCQRVKNCEFVKVNYSGFNHFDFLWGKDVNTLIMPTIFDLFSRY